MKNQKTHYGFTLIELIIVIAIIGIMAGLLLPNFMAARTRARDGALKADLKNLKTALQLYYTDYQQFPLSAGANTDIAGCGAAGTSSCGASSGNAFEAGGNSYMKKFPDSFRYYENTTDDTYVLKVTLENASDEDITKSQSKCSSDCPSSNASCCSGSLDYCLCPD